MLGTKELRRTRRPGRFGSLTLDAKFARKAVTIAIGLLGAWLTFALAVSGVTRHRAPDQALAFVPWEGVALASKAEQMLQLDPKVSPSKLKTLSREALRNYPLNAKAVRLLAIAYGLERQPDMTEKLIKKAADLTRRDAVTQLLLVEEAESRGDEKTALIHYDNALRTSSVAPQILFPRLARAIANPETRAALKPYVRARNSWAASFVNFAKDSSTNLSPLVDLVIETGGVPDAKQARTQRAELITALFEQKNYSDLERLLAHVPGASSNILTDASLETEDRRSTLGAAVWQLLDDAEAGANLSNESDGSRPILSVYANAATARPVAQKLLVLPPGQYRFAFKMDSIDRGADGTISWRLRCLEPAVSKALWQIESVYQGGGSDMVIGVGCRVQLLELLVAGGSGQTGMEATISGISLRRAGRGRAAAPGVPTS